MEIQTPKAETKARFLRAWTEYETSAKTGQLEARDYIEFCAAGQAQLATTQCLVKHAMRSPAWSNLEPAYNAWKNGQEIPATGTPLAAWPGITPQQSEILRMNGLKTVEDVAGMNDSHMARIRLPDVRSIRDLAKRFIEASSSRSFESALAERDRQIAEMKASIEKMKELAASRDLAPAQEQEDEFEEVPEEASDGAIPLPRRRGRPPKALMQEA